MPGHHEAPPLQRCSPWHLRTAAAKQLGSLWAERKDDDDDNYDADVTVAGSMRMVLVMHNVCILLKPNQTLEDT